MFTNKIEYKNIWVITFSGPQNSGEYITDTNFDECKISDYNNGEFECLGDGDSENQKPAMVQKSFLDRFLYMLRSSNLENKVLEAHKAQNGNNKKKTIIFTGHSFGGAIPSLVTLWALEKNPQISSLCITFGCPLVGDKVFSKATEREKWSSNFCHIVS